MRHEKPFSRLREYFWSDRDIDNTLIKLHKLEREVEILTVKLNDALTHNRVLAEKLAKVSAALEPFADPAPPAQGGTK